MKPPPETTRYSLQFVQILEILFYVQLLEAGLKMQSPPQNLHTNMFPPFAYSPSCDTVCIVSATLSSTLLEN